MAAVKQNIKCSASSYELQILYADSEDRSEQKPIKNFGKSSRAGTNEIFRGTHI